MNQYEPLSRYIKGSNQLDILKTKKSGKQVQKFYRDKVALRISKNMSDNATGKN